MIVDDYFSAVLKCFRMTHRELLLGSTLSMVVTVFARGLAVWSALPTSSLEVLGSMPASVVHDNGFDLAKICRLSSGAIRITMSPLSVTSTI